MLVSIRTRPTVENPADPIDLLRTCHDRIRRFVRTAIRLLLVCDESDDQIREAAAALRRYFEIALPLHVDDEELSLLPRLWASAKPRELSALNDSVSQHRGLDATLARLMPSWSMAAHDPRRWREIAADAAEDTLELEALFRSHLELEEKLIFPLARSVLSKRELDALAAEIRARRDTTTYTL